MKFIRDIKALRKDLSFIFILALCVIICIDFWLIYIPEFFRGGAKIGQIIYKLSFSYISAFIFYFLVVHLKNQKDKDNLYSYISQNTSKIINEAKNLVLALAEKSKITIKNSFPDKDELNVICKAIDPNSDAPLLKGLKNRDNYANWFEFFDYNRTRTIEASDKILEKHNFIDSELVHKLASIKDCSHFYSINIAINASPIGNKDLTDFESSIAKYFELVIDLENYYNKKLKEYN